MSISDRTLPARGVGLAAFAALLAAIALAALGSRYFGLGAYLDHIESNTAVAGWHYAQGVPLYQFEAGAPQFADYYGPLAYLVQIPGLFLLGPSVAASKLGSLLALVATIVVMLRHFSRQRGAASAAQGALFLVAALLFFAPVSFWVRPDPFETLLVAAGVALAPSALGVGVCVGLAINFKVHAFFYFLPILLDVMRHHGWRAAPRVALPAVVVFLLPFLLPGISLTDYVTGLAQQIGHRGQSSATIPAVLSEAVVLVLPIGLPLALERQPRAAKVFATAALGALMLLLYPATFPGAGAYHFLPLVPVLAEARFRLRPRGLVAEAALLPLLLLGFIGTQQTLQEMSARRDWDRTAGEALDLARQGPTRKVEIGYGDSRRGYEVSQLAKAELAFHSYPALFDAQILMELQQIGIDGSARWVPYLDDCRIERWLLPRGETPFETRSYFYDDGTRPLFGAGFRDAFFAHYRRVAVAGDFEVWDCEPAH